MSERQESGKRKCIPAAVTRQVLASERCAYCGEENFPLTVDHVIPVSRGGSDELENLAPACMPCNREKLNFTPDEWREWRLEMGYPWPPQSKSDFITEQFRKHWPQYLAEKAAEEAALNQEGE